jgi:cytochrome b involved in lipid metabolism
MTRERIDNKTNKSKNKQRPTQLSDVVMAKSEAMLLQKQQQQQPGSGSGSSVSSASSDTSYSDTSSASSSSKTSSTTTSLWWVHGKGYDLEEFVERHPGGVEAILLGKGRDCTALVESYHPFTTQHLKVLEKYLVVEEQATTNNAANLHGKRQEDEQISKDFFYEILKRRVSTVLMQKGIDPKQDRGATAQRTMYYCAVFASWIYTGYLHLSVREG